MAKFPVAFGKRKSAANKEHVDGQVSSFRVLERTEVGEVKPFDSGSGLGRPITTTTVRPYSQVDMLAEEDNMFTSLKINRYAHPSCCVFIDPLVSDILFSSLPLPDGSFPP